MGRWAVMAAGMGLIAILGAAPAAADTEPAAMEPVVVTASRESEKVSRVPEEVTVITAAEIEKSTALNVPELLSTVPGVHVSDVTGNRRSYRVDIRGFGEVAPANLLVLVDGRRINQPDLSGVDWTLIPLDRIERIEIVRGSRGSVLYGDNATAGVINIITKDGARNQAVVSAEAGSYDTYKASAEGSLVGRRWSAALFGSYLDTGGYRDNSDSRAKDLGLNLRFDPVERLGLSLTSGWHKDDSRLPGALTLSELESGTPRTATVHPDDFADTDDYYVTGGLDAGITGNDHFKLENSWRRRTMDAFASFEEGNFRSDTQIDTIIVSPHFIFQEDYGDVANRLLFGVDFTHAEEDINNRSLFFGTTSSGRFTLTKENLGYYAQDDLTVGHGVTLSGGYRHDRVKFDFEARSAGGIPDARMDEDVWNAAVNYAYGNGSHAYASFARAFRYPLLDELFNFFTNTIDRNLQPQTSDDYELGVSHVLAGGLTLTVNAFRIETDDEIFYNPEAFTNQNLDGTTIRQGAGIILRFRRAGWDLGAGYTYTDAKIDGGPFDSRRVPDVPRNLATADAAYSFGFGLRLGLIAKYVGERPYISDFENAFEEQDSYTVVNARISYTWRRLTFFANLNNIFDEKYSDYGVLGSAPVEPAVYPSPRFNVMAGVTARFGGV